MSDSYMTADEQERDVDDLPNIFAVLREVFETSRDADWEHYILKLPRPIDPNDAVRNDVLEAIVESLEAIRKLTGWDMGVALLLAGCQSTVEEMPAERAPTEVLAKVSGRLNKVHQVVAAMVLGLEGAEDVKLEDPPTLVRRLMAWGAGIEQSPFVDMMRHDWDSAGARAGDAAGAIAHLVKLVSTSDFPCEAGDVARKLVAEVAAVESDQQAVELIAAAVASGVLELSRGKSQGLLFLPAS